jgi:hypothetical protein
LPSFLVKSFETVDSRKSGEQRNFLGFGPLASGQPMIFSGFLEYCVPMSAQSTCA